jgi:hypothetical protein
VALLAAKALTRTNRPQQAIEQLRSIEDPGLHGVNVAIRSRLTQSIAEAKLGNTARSSSHIEAAAQLATCSEDEEIAYQVMLHRAFHAWTSRELGESETLARAAMSSSNAETYALAAQFLGFAAASRGCYMEQVSILEQTLSRLDALHYHDVWLEASLLQNIAGVIVDFHLPAIARRLAERAEAIDWTNETALALYHIFRALAYSRSFGSDPLAPFEYLERAERVVPSDGWTLVSRLDRIFLINELGGHRFLSDFDGEAEIRRAEEVANAIDWPQIPGEERFGLLMLGDLLASQRPRDAERYLEIYRATKRNMSPLLLGRSDARISAVEDSIDGIVTAQTRDKQRGVELLARAFTFWEDVGFSWRATRAAIKLYQLTEEPGYIDWASREAQHYPFSWMSDAVARAGRRRAGASPGQSGPSARSRGNET